MNAPLQTQMKTPRAAPVAVSHFSSGLLQRKCACGGSPGIDGECTACRKKQFGLQTKLMVNAPGDIYEQEAERISDQIASAPAATALIAAPPRIQRAAGQPATQVEATPPSIDRALAGSGKPLEPALQAEMEQRLGHDFSRVRIHTGTAAEQSAQDVHAYAYTVGHDIVFGAGRFRSDTREGRRLIAHELTHVVQQAGSLTMLQRAETDTVPGCAALIDSEADVDAKVNASLAAARATAGTPPAGRLVAQGVEDDLGRNVQTGRTAIEVWASTLPGTKASLPAQSATKYAGVTYRLWSNPMFPILNPTMKVKGLCIGSDKLGHFFQQGADYRRTEAASGTAAAEEESERSEGGGFGLISTGVFSNADQEANRQGGRFYRDLIASPTMTFAIARYISSRWSEIDNPNFYEDSVGHQVWANTLTGYWSGQALAPAPAFAEVLLIRLNATSTGTITGIFSVGGRTPVGNITNGVITYNTTTVRGASAIGSRTSPTPISGVHIEFDWSEGGDSGKGFLDSSGERHLTGRWGRGTSNTDRGAWDIQHT